jgi:DNA processing protein
MDHFPIRPSSQELVTTTLALRKRGLWPLPPGPLVAIVGARRPTTYGDAVAARLAEDLTAHGTIILSGLSVGIETVAHQAALDAGGRPVAVLGTGLDAVYPATCAALAERIVSAGGTLLSAFPDDARPSVENFPCRNATIATLADVVVLVEAAVNATALATVEAALALDKPVLAVPGSIFSPYSVGCHQPLRAGVGLVQSSADVLAALPGQRPDRASILAAVADQAVPS